MKNFISEGATITAPAPAAGAVSGNAYLLGTLVGIATTTQTVGTPTAFSLVGVFEVPKVTAEVWAVGATVYWDDTAKKFTSVVGTNTLAGNAWAAAANPSAVGRVRLKQ
jgi:predicted RecA/RadA family phage recombinase